MASSAGVQKGNLILSVAAYTSALQLINIYEDFPGPSIATGDDSEEEESRTSH